MKGFWSLTAAALLALMALAPPLVEAQQMQSFFVGVVGDNGEAITTGRCRVLTAGTFNTDATIYTDGTLATTKTNPITLDATVGSCTWYAGSTTTSFDVIVYVDSGPYTGSRLRVDGVTRTGAKRVTSTRDYSARVLSIPFTKNTANQTSTTTLPAGAIVDAVVAEVTTAVASSTVSFGYASPGAVTSFCNAQSAATAGFFNCPLGAPIQVGTAALALMYVTSNHAIAGYLHVSYRPAGGNF